MSNQRSENKRLVNFWFTHDEAAKLAEAAASLGVNMTDFVKRAVSELIVKEQLNGHKDEQRGDGSHD